MNPEDIEIPTVIYDQKEADRRAAQAAMEGIENAVPRTPKAPKPSLHVKKAAPLIATPEPQAGHTEADRKIAALEAMVKMLMERQSPSVQVAEPSGNPTDELVKIMLRREAKQIEKEEDEAQRKAAAREDMLRIGREQEALKQMRESNCSHTKENGKTAICASQIHNDGLVHPFCQRCFKTFATRRPSHELQATSVDA